MFGRIRSDYDKRADALVVPRVALLDDQGTPAVYAVREWARGDKRAGWAVERADRERLERLRAFFEALGYDRQHAAIRARVFYYHQIRYYAIRVRQSIAERRKTAQPYNDKIGRESCRASVCQYV